MPQATASRTKVGEPSIAGFDNLVAEAVALLEAGQPLDITALTATCPELSRTSRKVAANFGRHGRPRPRRSRS